MTEPWRVAELLEEIAKKADPASVLRGSLPNAERADGVLAVVSAGVDTDLCSASYFFPLERVMAGVSGTAEEVVEYVNTGLGDKEKASLGEFDGRRYLIIIQYRTDRGTASKVREVMGIEPRSSVRLDDQS